MAWYTYPAGNPPSPRFAKGEGGFGSQGPVRAGGTLDTARHVGGWQARGAAEGRGPAAGRDGEAGWLSPHPATVCRVALEDMECRYAARGRHCPPEASRPALIPPSYRLGELLFLAKLLNGILQRLHTGEPQG
jgi:hypothetical protein